MFIFACGKQAEMQFPAGVKFPAGFILQIFVVLWPISNSLVHADSWSYGLCITMYQL